MPVSDKLRCASRIAAGLLDALSATGDVAGMGRVRRVYSNDCVNVRAEASWISRRTIDQAFRTLGSDRNFARRVGYALVTTERIGFFLFTEGVATIEKAYRRCEPLLAREDREGRFHTLEVGDGRARIAYYPGQGAAAGAGETDQPPWNSSFCGVREGMLEALPLSFGLLPAKVEESQCVGEGAAHCCFEVRFEGKSNQGALFGLAAGAAAAIGLCAWGLPGTAYWIQGIVGGIITLLSAAAGHSYDLVAQLGAVAGARRGHLALLEQADIALAEKMDQLAKVGEHLESARGESTDRLRAILEERSLAASGTADSDDDTEQVRAAADQPRAASGGGDTESSVRAAREIYAALGPLQRGLEQMHRVLRDRELEPEDMKTCALDTLRLCVDETRRLQSVGAALATSDRKSENAHRPIQLAELLTRAADCVRSQLQGDQELILDIENGLPLVRCEPFQMEQVAYQLLKNAADASPPDGVVRAGLRRTPEGIELTVEDRGDGIPEEILDQVFDPFAIEGAVGNDSGLGLAICYRIVVEHGGEMRLASISCEGTCVTVVLPPDLQGTEPG